MKSTYPPLTRHIEDTLLSEWPSHPRLNLACGNDLRSDWDNVDLHQPYADFRIDLQKFPWPIENSQYRTIVCHQYLEHIPPLIDGKDGLLQTLEEIARILEPRGRFLATVPYPNSSVDLGNPTHYRRIAPYSFYFLGKNSKSTITNAYYLKKIVLEKVVILRSFRIGKFFDSSYHPKKYLGWNWNIGRKLGIAFLFKKVN